MESFNILNTILLTIPETLINFYFALLMIGESIFLPFKDGVEERKRNLIKLIVAALSVSFFVDIAGSFFNEDIKNILSTIFAIVILMLVYRLKWYKAILAVLIFTAYLFVSEAPYMMFVINLIFKGVNNLFHCNPLIRFLYSLPIRIAQLSILVSLWNIRVVTAKLKKSKEDIVFFIIASVGLTIAEMASYYNFCYVYANLPSINKIIGYVGVASFGIINYFLMKLYISSTINKKMRYNEGKFKRRENFRYEKNKNLPSSRCLSSNINRNGSSILK
ncbi:MAG: hypothetical protein Q8880_06310 [Bacteroidota bacterium]|nr:hypothetical protein [Bacteroidota bacterium]